jgi:hypothetical protein
LLACEEVVVSEVDTDGVLNTSADMPETLARGRRERCIDSVKNTEWQRWPRDDAANDPDFDSGWCCDDESDCEEEAIAESAVHERTVELFDQEALATETRQSAFGAENDLQIWIEKLHRDGPDRRLDPVTMEQAAAAKKLFEEFPNMHRPLMTVVGSLYLSARSSCEFSIPPILIQGPPGCGKTELVRRLAELLSMPLHKISMGSVNGNFELPGGHRGYRGATVGLLCKHLINSEVANPIYLFDEAELGASELYQPLLQFVEDDTFQDHFLEIEFNTKHVNIVFITNDKELLPSAIRSRLIEFDVGQPSLAEKIAICQRMYTRMRMADPRYEMFPVDLEEGCLYRLSAGPLRDVRKNIEQAFCRSAVRAGMDGVLAITEEDITAAPMAKQRIGFI